MKLKNLKLLGVILAFLFCFPLHFLYDKMPCFITSIISPVNESIWEHMKILFGSIILSGVIQKVIVKVSKLPYKNICISNFICAVLSIIIFLILYIPIYITLGEILPLTIFIMLIAIIIVQIISIYIVKYVKDLKMENLAIIFVIITYILFGILTYNPIKIELFKDPVKISYGIK